MLSLACSSTVASHLALAPTPMIKRVRLYRGLACENFQGLATYARWNRERASLSLTMHIQVKEKKEEAFQPFDSTQKDHVLHGVGIRTVGEVEK